MQDEDSPITVCGNANELCAGYAADAYARYKGIGAVSVTYSVGAFSILNCIAGSFTEMAPVVLINGAPTNKETQNEQNAGILYSHTTGYKDVDIHMFRPITAAAERITNAQQAPYQIDAALTVLLTQKRPVYFEVSEDVWRTPCKAPEGKLSSGAFAFEHTKETKKAVETTIQLIKQKKKEEKKFIFWAGVELHRYGLQDEFIALMDAVNQHHVAKDSQVKFVTSPLSKSVISEDHQYFSKCMTMSKANIAKEIGPEGVVIGIGAWTIGKDVHNQNIRSENTILAAHDSVLTGAFYHPMIPLKDYIVQLTQAFIDLAEIEQLAIHGHDFIPLPITRLYATGRDTTMSYDQFYKTLSGHMSVDDILVADAGFPLIGAQGVHIPARNGFVGQAAWLSIGFSVGAATGIKCANPDKRVFVSVGDGAFHETCQAVSDHNAYGHNTVVFVISNGVYGIEQYIVNPNPYRTGDHVVDYKKDPRLNDMYAYNKLPQWDFVKLGEAFGSIGRRVTSQAELDDVFEDIRSHPDKNFLVELVVPERDSPTVMHKLANKKDSVGEDEYLNPHWAPEGKF